VTRGGDDGFGDLLGAGLGVDMGVGDEERPVLEDHQAERADGMKLRRAKELPDVVQVPEVLAERAADHRIRLVPIDHDGADGGGVGAHDGAREIGGDAAPLHHRMIGAPVIAVARVVFGVHQFEIDRGPDRQARAFGAPLDHLGPADQDRGFGGLLEHRLGRAQDALILPFREDDAARRGGGGLEDRAHDQGGAEDRLVQLRLVGLDVLERPRAPRPSAIAAFATALATTAIRRGSKGFGIR
jgi:hypothetical protein